MAMSLNILLWRNWTPLFDFPATFSALATNSMGGTESQLLWHAANLSDLGHKVQVLGATKEDVIEEGVQFIGASGRIEQQNVIEKGIVRKPDFIFLEGAFDGAFYFRSKYPEATLIHIGQNIDCNSDKKAFQVEKFVDAYAFVSPGHLAKYCSRYPRLRHKFLLIRNVVPWKRFYENVPDLLPEDHIIWVGAWTKKGLRQWAETMEKILMENPTYRWILCGPSHGSIMSPNIPKHIFYGLNFDFKRISVLSLPLVPLVHQIRSARMLLVSLGMETGSISTLDGHAMARPVLSGNDIVYKYVNPEATGVRVTSAEERYRAITTLINNPNLCDEMGKLGRDLIVSDFTEANQCRDLHFALQSLPVIKAQRGLGKHIPPMSFCESAERVLDTFKRRLRILRAS